jgi:hypothetical protein
MFVFGMSDRKMKMPGAARPRCAGCDAPAAAAKNHYVSGEPLKGSYPGG